MVAIMVGMMDTRLQLAIGNETSHIQIHNPGYLENNDLKYTLDDYQETVRQIESIQCSFWQGICLVYFLPFSKI